MERDLVDRKEVLEDVKKQFGKYGFHFGEECENENGLGRMVADSINNAECKNKVYDYGEYWGNVCGMYKKQREKGLASYGQTLEDNTDLGVIERITMAQEEMIDMLVYLEHIKDWLKKNGRV